jgi:hypothetical protein
MRHDLRYEGWLSCRFCAFMDMQAAGGYLSASEARSRSVWVYLSLLDLILGEQHGAEHPTALTRQHLTYAQPDGKEISSRGF